MFTLMDEAPRNIPVYKGIHALNIDKKHRIMIPVGFGLDVPVRVLMEPVGFGSVDALCVGLEEHRDAAFVSRPAYVQQSDYLEPLDVPIDKQRRLLIPAAYRQIIESEKVVMVAGSVGCFYIFERQSFLTKRPNLVSRL